MFPTIETEGYYNRENQWVLVTVINGHWEWRGVYPTKAEAVSDLLDTVDAVKPEFAMVIKSPYVAAEE